MLLTKLLMQVTLLVLTVPMSNIIIILIRLFITSWCKPLKTDSSDSVHPSLSFCWGVQKGGIYREVRGKGGGDYFEREMVQLLKKNKLKSELFNEKKFINKNIFFSLITKNSS